MRLYNMEYKMEEEIVDLGLQESSLHEEDLGLADFAQVGRGSSDTTDF